MKTKLKSPTKPTAAAATVPAPAPRQPPVRKVQGWVHVPDTNGNLQGSLVHFRAEYNPCVKGGSLRLKFELEDYNTITLLLDHVQARAATVTLRDSLDEFARFHRRHDHDESAVFPNRPQVNCNVYQSWKSREDEAINVEFLVDRNMFQFSAGFSYTDKTYSLCVYLTSTEAKALHYEFQRALADLERYGDTGL